MKRSFNNAGWVMIGASLLLFAACSTGRKSISVEAPRSVIGHWRSFELGGPDIGTHLKEVDYTFGPDMHFSAVGVIEDGRKEAYSGRYSVDSTTLHLTVAGKGTDKVPYTLSDGVLVIRDPKLDSYVKFRKADASP